MNTCLRCFGAWKFGAGLVTSSFLLLVAMASTLVAASLVLSLLYENKHSSVTAPRQLPSSDALESCSSPFWRICVASNLRASLLLVAMPFAPSSYLLLVVRPGAPSSVLAPSSDALCS